MSEEPKKKKGCGCGGKKKMVSKNRNLSEKKPIRENKKRQLKSEIKFI